MPTVYIAIGSNLGDREANCLMAIGMLAEAGIVVTAYSPMQETEPWGVQNQPKFINMAVSTETTMPARKLLELLKQTEVRMGRKPAARFGPRKIDLDLLLYGADVIDEAGLKVPHPRMHERAFVLGPLARIAPDAMHPVLKKTIKELAEGLK